MSCIAPGLVAVDVEGNDDGWMDGFIWRGVQGYPRTRLHFRRQDQCLEQRDGTGMDANLPKRSPRAHQLAGRKNERTKV